MGDSFTVTARDGAARAGVLRTAHGEVRTPAFMPVGTKATVKSVDPDELHALGAEIVLGNAYHLHFRPGEELVAELGGLHTFMGWDGAILTDSGGFQVFSLRDTLLAVDDDGVTFRSVYDGTPERFTPELSARVQERLGSDVAMCLDICPPAGVPQPELEEAVRRTTVWAERQRDLPRAAGQLRFAITQGGLDGDLRQRSSEALVELDFDGYAIGGLSVGEHRRPMFDATTEAAGFLPEDKPRYFMGIGDPEGVLEVDRARRRHVRLRPADAHRAHRQRPHERRPPQPSQRSLRRRRAPPGRRLLVPGLLPLQSGLHPAPRQPARNPRAAAPQPA